MSVRLKRVPEPPAQNCSGLHDPAGQGGAGPHSACLSGQCVQISKKEGCGAAAPLTAPPLQKKPGSRSRGGGSGSIALAIMHGESGQVGGRKKAGLRV